MEMNWRLVLEYCPKLARKYLGNGVRTTRERAVSVKVISSADSSHRVRCDAACASICAYISGLWRNTDASVGVLSMDRRKRSSQNAVAFAMWAVLVPVP